ncbi:hypothetical protein BRADI_1g72100v3 [Brachypodium distachyon]|uniref:Uncharacterized protein n=1 Tax=Brachypodium distachyon TaxID=15368 RepID=A0A0Q3K0A9_BRADI|nr:hypothetical protein BRADI_1g72100v3 [Brachypodium distachyon]
MAEPEVAATAATAMETEASEANPSLKREREEGDVSAASAAAEAVEEAAAKKPRLEEEAKDFASSVDMFDYFFALLHSWTPQLEINKYEHMVLEDLVKKGHAEPSKKIGAGVEAFEIRNHPVWQSRCFFVRRVDGSSDDFSFRKCVDNILPLPEDLKMGKSNGKKGGGGHYKGNGGRGGRGGGGRGGGSFRGGRGRGRRGN